jgi:anti-anti-sigma factor
MNSIRSKPIVTQAIEAAALSELVRGNEQLLLERVAPLVRRRSVCLDLSSVERIDAAGVAALISLYCMARDAGQVFSICGALPRVREILALVGLEPTLECHNVVHTSQSGPRLERPAA